MAPDRPHRAAGDDKHIPLTESAMLPKGRTTVGQHSGLTSQQVLLMLPLSVPVVFIRAVHGEKSGTQLIQQIVSWRRPISSLDLWACLDNSQMYTHGTPGHPAGGGAVFFCIGASSGHQTLALAPGGKNGLFQPPYILQWLTKHL